MSITATPASFRDFSSATDRDLVSSAGAGLEGGFEELVRRYQRPITAYVYRMVGDYEAPLDLAQEISNQVYDSLSRYMHYAPSLDNVRSVRAVIACDQE